MLDQVERVIEAFGSAIEGIGHVLRPHMRREVEEAADLVPRVARRKLDELLVVRAVHGEEEVEAVVIGVR